MTGRDRVRAMFDRRDHDRVPRDDGYWSETISRWNREGFVGDWHDARESIHPDFHPLVGTTPRLYTEDQVVRDDGDTRVVRDQWGGVMRYWKNRSGVPEHLGFECDSREAWERQIKPRMRAMTPQDNFYGGVRLANLRNLCAQGLTRGRWLYVSALESFELMRRLIGDETMLIAMAEDPYWVRDISETVTNLVLRDLDAAMACGIESDGLWVYGDMAYNHGTVCSPAMYRDLIWPDHKRLADWAHAHGMKFIFHTDGDVRGVLDDYIRAGFDCLQPLEAKAAMDVRRMAPIYGDRLAMFGNIDMAVLGTNDLEKIEIEVRSKLAAGMAVRAYAYHSDHSVPPTVSCKTYCFLLELLDRYGRYC